MSDPLYPALLRLRDKPVLVVGGGPVAVRKVRRLLASGARVTLIAPEVARELDEAAAAGAILWERRLFRATDVEGASLVISATGVDEVDTTVAEAAQARAIWVNVADGPVGGDVQLPAMIAKGPLVVTVSTSGAAPGYAARLVREIGEQLPEGVDEIVGLLGDLREELRRRVPDDRDLRRRAFAAALSLTAGPEKLAEAGPDAARRALFEAAQEVLDGPSGRGAPARGGP